MVLVIQKINSVFASSTKSKQANGLSVVIGMIENQFKQIVVREVKSVEDVHLLLKQYKPKSVIFEAMSFAYLTVLEVKRLFPDVNVFVHIHSKFPFLGYENHSLKYITKCLDYGVGIIFNHRDALNMIPHKNATYLPNIYSFSSDIKSNREINTSEIHIGCHGSLRHLKNQTVQAAAACRYANKIGKKLFFHVNSTRDDGERVVVLNNINSVLQHYGHSLVETKWMEHRDFVKYCSESLDLGLQVSMCETFNLVAADYVTADIPLVVSPEIDWLPKEIQAMPTDISDIVSKIEYALANKQTRNNNKQHLVDHNHKAVDDWKQFLEEYS